MSKQMALKEGHLAEEADYYLFNKIAMCVFARSEATADSERPRNPHLR